MNGFPGSPRTLRGGIVLVDPVNARILQSIVLQYNPDTLTRTLAPQAIGPEPGDRSEALRLKGPPRETIKLDAEFDAVDQLEKPDADAASQVVARVGLSAQLAAIELIVYPTSNQLLANDIQSRAGVFEVIPVQAPLPLFVWSKQRIMPVRLTEFSVTEEAFDTMLNPIRAKVSIGMRVLTTDDLNLSDRGGALYFAYQRQKEMLAAMARPGQFGSLGISRIPGT